MLKKRKEESIILHIIKLSDQLKSRREKISYNMGVSNQQWLILLYLAYDQNIPFLKRFTLKRPLLSSELEDSLHVTRPNITAITNVLLEKGLITQAYDDILIKGEKDSQLQKKDGNC